MIEPYFIERLNKVNATKNSRIEFANWLLEDPARIEDLFDAEYNDVKYTIKVFWGLDTAVELKPCILHPYLNKYLPNLKLQTHESIRRVLARINFHYLDYIQNETSNFQIDANLEQKIIDFSFELLLDKSSTAAKAFSMSSLSILSFKHEWVKEELVSYLEKNYMIGSKGFQARARHVLKQLETGK